MSRSASKTGKGGPPKTPKDNLAGSTPASTIKLNMVKGGSPGSSHQETQKSNMADKKKKGLNEREDLTPDHSREELLAENTLEASRIDEHRHDSQLPSKSNLSEMLKALETSIKAEITMLRSDLGNLLTRVEGAEDKLDKQEREISELKEQLKTIQQNQIKTCYRLEDQENRDRRQNLRLRGVPENRGEGENRGVPGVHSWDWAEKTSQKSSGCTGWAGWTPDRLKEAVI